jgi:hypothetical protein
MNTIARKSLYALVLVLLLLCGCDQDELTSHWKYDDIRIDGEPQEWQNVSLYQLNEPSAGLALCNDSQFLYLRLTTHDSGLQQQLNTGGLQIWIDPAGGQDKAFGIKIASGRSGMGGPPSAGGSMSSPGNGGPQNDTDMADGGGAMPENEQGPGMAGPPNGEMSGRSQEPGELSFEFSIDEEVVGDYSAINNSFDLTLAQGEQQGGLIYEIRIPLFGDLYQGRVLASDAVTIGLETVEAQGMGGQMQGEGGEQGGGEQDGGQGGGGQQGGGQQGGGQQGGGQQGGDQQDPLEFWFTVKLAPSPEA